MATRTEVRQTLAAGTFALISASHGDENDVRDTALLAGILTGWNHTIIKAIGKWEGTEEESFFVVGISEERTLTLGRLFAQQAVIYGNRLIFDHGGYVTGDLSAIEYVDPAVTDNCTVIDCSDGTLAFRIPFADA